MARPIPRLSRNISFMHLQLENKEGNPTWMRRHAFLTWYVSTRRRLEYCQQQEVKTVSPPTYHHGLKGIPYHVPDVLVHLVYQRSADFKSFWW